MGKFVHPRRAQEVEWGIWKGVDPARTKLGPREIQSLGVDRPGVQSLAMGKW